MWRTVAPHTWRVGSARGVEDDDDCDRVAAAAVIGTVLETSMFITSFYLLVLLTLKRVYNKSGGAAELIFLLLCCGAFGMNVYAMLQWMMDACSLAHSGFGALPNLVVCLAYLSFWFVFDDAIARSCGRHNATAREMSPMHVAVVTIASVLVIVLLINGSETRRYRYALVMMLCVALGYVYQVYRNCVVLKRMSSRKAKQWTVMFVLLSSVRCVTLLCNDLCVTMDHPSRVCRFVFMSATGQLVLVVCMHVFPFGCMLYIVRRKQRIILQREFCRPMFDAMPLHGLTYDASQRLSPGGRRAGDRPQQQPQDGPFGGAGIRRAQEDQLSWDMYIKGGLVDVSDDSENDDRDDYDIA